jgi:uncharacterized membrane protein
VVAPTSARRLIRKINTSWPPGQARAGDAVGPPGAWVGRAPAWLVACTPRVAGALARLRRIVHSSPIRMSTLPLPPTPHARSAGQRLPTTPAPRALRWAAALWLGVALLGQAIFVTYVAKLYGGATLTGDLNGWNKVMPRGYVPGDTAGNSALIVHVLLTVVILLGGALQLLPRLRRQAPRVHHWVGRGYITLAVVMSLTGLFMVWTRGEPLRLGQHLGISLNALLILAFAMLALRAARARRIDDHRRWALRLYVVVLGVWFFRLGLTLWLVIHRAPVGFDPATFSGPFLTALSIAQTLLPLALLELYLRAPRSPRPGAQQAAAVGLVMLSVLMAAGITTATLMLWRPHL